MKKNLIALVGMALAISLAVVPMAACSNQSNSDSAASTAESAVDVASFETLGDALKIGSQAGCGWDENYFVCVTNIEDSPIRLVAAFNDELCSKLNEADLLEDENNEVLCGVVGDVPVMTAEDLSAGIPKQEDLDAFVGKTGQDVFDAGYTLYTYVMYGGDTTIAQLDLGYYSCNFTFDGTVTEADTEYDGEPLKTLKVKSAEYIGTSDLAIDPAQVAQEKAVE